MRRSKFFGDRNILDTIEDTGHSGAVFPVWLESLRNTVSQFLCQSFECALVLEFPNGSASLAPQYENINRVANSMMAWVCVGTAKCSIEICDDNKLLQSFSVDPGSLYTLEGDFQQHLKHGIRQQLSLKQQPRYIICFRNVLPTREKV